MARHNGPKIAPVYPALVFPCLRKKCRGFGIHLLSECQTHQRTIRCIECSKIYTQDELTYLSAVKMPKPCAASRCPYCSIFAIFMADEKGIIEGMGLHALIDLIDDSQSEIETVDFDKYEIEIPDKIICGKCHHPYKLAVSECTLFRIKNRTNPSKSLFKGMSSDIVQNN